MGWFDGNPAHLWEYPPAELARRYVADYGGVAAVIAKARGYADDGDLRFAATLLNHAVFAEPDNESAAMALAQVYDQLGYGAENGTWRNFYLVGARTPVRTHTGRPGYDRSGNDGAALSVEMIIDSRVYGSTVCEPPNTM